MPGQFLNRLDILARLQQMGSKEMAETMRGEPERQSYTANRLANSALEMLLVHMMPPDIHPR